MVATSLLQAFSIRKTFNGVPALSDGSLNLRPGTVHALCGGNGAGKSTFLNVIMGLIAPDGGELLIDGKPHEFMGPAEAINAGISMITQELSLINDLSVAENIFLGRQPVRFGLVDHSAMRLRAGELLQQLNFDVPAEALVGDLSVARKQLVEIARAISTKSRILIMDEPTSALSERETLVLFNAMRSLKAHNVGIIYVTHRLRELFGIADDYTVFRDGRFVESGAIADLDHDRLVHLIVGAPLHNHQVANRGRRGDRRLAVTRLSRVGEFTDVSLAAEGGEVLGIYGLVGSGRSEFLNCLFGLTRAHSGEVAIDGERVAIRSPRDAMKKGFSLVSEDRKESGLVGCLNVRENMALSSLRRLGSLVWVRRRAERAETARMKERLDVRTASLELAVENLSGGNQQKVVFARCLLTKPKVLLCDEPTRGVDAGAKQQIFGIVESFVAEGGAAVVVSSELEEILQVSDRIVVFRAGRIAGELSRADASQEALMRLAA